MAGDGRQMTKKKQKPAWTPENPGPAFAGNILDGVEGGHDGMEQKEKEEGQTDRKRKRLNNTDYAEGVLKGDRTVLARAITLIESNAETHITLAQKVLNTILPHTGQSIRIGISGVPGAGKSTFIESFGLHLIEQGHQVAVLAIDPSSSLTGGSILGDKTRMEKLARAPQSFIRPSPSGGTLGGVARKTRETILLCEAAGFDVILVETIGVGQSEITVRSMVDFFILLQIAGAGDDLQGIKRGAMELADLVVVNKADGDNRTRAEAARQELEMALHYLPPSTKNWKTPVLTCSALTGDNIPEIWSMAASFKEKTQADGTFAGRRQLQLRDWLHTLLQERVMEVFRKNSSVAGMLDTIEQQVINGELTSTKAAQRLIEAYLEGEK